MQNSNIDISDELTYNMDVDDETMKHNTAPLLSEEAVSTEEDTQKQDKLQQLRQRMDDRMNKKKKQEALPKGPDLYLQKVTNFLITSFFLNLAIEHIFTYSLMHDYINGYLKNKTYVWNGRIEGNNFCFMLFYGFRLIGFFITDTWLIDSMQSDEEVARKVILTAILGSTASVFIATRILQAGNFVWFCMFYAGFPAMITGSQKPNIAPVSIFLIINLSRIGRKNQINLKLLYSLQYMSYFASIIILSLACTTFINSENIRPLQINALPENESTFFIRALYAPVSKEMKSIPNRLLFVPILIVVCGMIGVITLYGWRCGNKEDPTNEIEWDAIKIKKKMNAVKDLRIDDVINFFHDEDQQDEEYSLRSESMATSEPGTPAKKSFIKSHNLSKPKKEGQITQQYVPEEDDTKKLIEAHFRGKPVNINFDKERGEILISYKPKIIATSIWEIVFSKQMAYLHLSSVTPLFFMNKLNRMLLTYLYTDLYVAPAMIAIGVLSCVYLLANILLLHAKTSKRFMIINYTVFNYVLILLFSYLAESLVGMLLLASMSVFLFVYMHVLMCYIVSLILPHSRMIAKVFPIFYSTFLLGNLIKVFVVDSFRQSFQMMVFVFLILQGLGFLFITGVNLKKLRQLFLDYAALQEKMASDASKVGQK